MKIAVLGYGTVGSGVCELLVQKKLSLVKVYNRPNALKKAVLKELYTDNIDDILNDETINVIIEVMGHISAYEIIKKALKKKKHIITANKEVVALYLNELVDLAKQMQVMFLFEASVGGGMPVIRNICQLVKSDQIIGMQGILNGTTNYILTRMKQGKEFAEALKEAQMFGYAEANPQNDLEGLDMVRKIAILTMLATNSEIDINLISHKGINQANKAFINYLKKDGYDLKLIAEAKIIDDKCLLKVEPVACHTSSLLANIADANNGLIIQTRNRGNIIISGLGAGKFPTAASIMDDLAIIMHNENYVSYQANNKMIQVPDIETQDYYIYDNNKVVLKKNISPDEAKKYAFYARII